MTAQTNREKGMRLMGFVRRPRANYTRGAGGKPVRLLGGFTLLCKGWREGEAYDVTLLAKVGEDEKVRDKIAELNRDGKDALVVLSFVRNVRDEEQVDRDGRTYRNRRIIAHANQVRVVKRYDPLPARAAA